MKGSLQDQLLKAGLADKGAAKQVRAEKRKKQKQKKKQPEVSEAQRAAQQAAEEKRARDQALNQAQQAEREKKAIAAQIKQLVTINKQPTGGGDTLLNFTDENVVKRMYVSGPVHSQVLNARLAVVKDGNDYALVPVPVADKIAERNPAMVVFRADDRPKEEQDSEEDDWYADYEIPDDLTW
ncbi:DUF2058 domain-containing protein [Alteromonas sediminis]|uniref:DUF2058 domain-containing protein n=1 Tax=Alteromonas sediminis TaxID=2259342 RepID=A0A3N5Y2M5_9ALTE|nr:DUF2058 domain-containing protein [Alteromonas sediminis]RPJ67293.1 DUF2058 domain-containing protein [Alteromonas sediminis]